MIQLARYGLFINLAILLFYNLKTFTMNHPAQCNLIMSIRTSDANQPILAMAVCKKDSIYFIWDIRKIIKKINKTNLSFNKKIIRLKNAAELIRNHYSSKEKMEMALNKIEQEIIFLERENPLKSPDSFIKIYYPTFGDLFRIKGITFNLN